MQSVSSRIWTRVAVFIFSDDNNYTTGTSTIDLINLQELLSMMAWIVSILLYGCTTWTLTKRLEKKLDGNYTRMLRAILNKSWGKHPARHQLYGYLAPITKTIQVRRTRHAEHCWRSRDELISDVLLWTPTYCRAKAGRPSLTYIQQLCSPEDLPEVMNHREMWREMDRDTGAWLDMMMMVIFLQGTVKNPPRF